MYKFSTGTVAILKVSYYTRIVSIASKYGFFYMSMNGKSCNCCSEDNFAISYIFINCLHDGQLLFLVNLSPSRRVSALAEAVNLSRV